MILRLTFCLLLIALTACSSTGGAGSKDVAQVYAAALKDLKDGLYPEATTGFSEVKTKFPYSRYAALADLRLADTHFEQGKYIEAVDAYRSFLKYHPTHPEAVYAMLQIAESYYQQIPTDWWFLPPGAEKDQANTRLAISAFRDLLARFSAQAKDTDQTQIEDCRKQIELLDKNEQDAKNPEPPLELESCRQKVSLFDALHKGTTRLNECRKKLAEHELYVAEFYFKRERFAAAASRAEGLVRDYPGLGLDVAALWLTVRARLAVGELDAAHKAFKHLQTEFPQSSETAAALKLLGQTAPKPAKVEQGG